MFWVNRIFLFIFALGLFAVAVAEAEDGRDFYSDQAELYSLALKSAYKSMRPDIDVRGKTVVITPTKKYLVVSFIGSQERMGGRAHAVFDVEKKEIVHISVED